MPVLPNVGVSNVGVSDAGVAAEAVLCLNSLNQPSTAPRCSTQPIDLTRNAGICIPGILLGLGTPVSYALIDELQCYRSFQDHYELCCGGEAVYVQSLAKLVPI